MQINTNLAKILSDLAKAVEGEGLNISVNISISLPQSESINSEAQPGTATYSGEASEAIKTQVQVGPSVDDAPQSSTPVQADEEGKSSFVSAESAVPAPEASTDPLKTAAVPSSKAEAAPEPKTQVSKPEVPARPRPRTQASPVVGDQRRMRALQQRQAQLRQAGVKVPEELMQAPNSSGEAQEKLDKLRPYMAGLYS